MPFARKGSMNVFFLKIIILFTSTLSAAGVSSATTLTYRVPRSEDEVDPQVPVSRVAHSNITYYLFTSDDDNIDDPAIIKPNEMNLLHDTNFCSMRDTIFVIHGWQNQYGSPVNKFIVKGMLDNHNVNIFVVDWAPIAMQNYIRARNAVGSVGKFVANFVRTLTEDFGLKLSKLAFVGHSLGAHVAGNAGADLDGEVELIVGLDPAGISFTVANINNRLDATDAKFVHVIHTDVRTFVGLGFKPPIGHVDFYPNGNGIQPGCGMDLMGQCSHSRSYYYYAESLSEADNHRFMAYRCPDIEKLEGGNCMKNPRTLMGRYPVDRNASGVYYLFTKSEAPYARG